MSKDHRMHVSAKSHAKRSNRRRRLILEILRTEEDLQKLHKIQRRLIGKVLKGGHA